MGKYTMGEKIQKSESLTIQGLKNSLKNPKCAFCGIELGTESIIDGETQREVLICVDCDNKMNWKKYDYPSEIEDRDDDIRHGIY